MVSGYNMRSMWHQSSSQVRVCFKEIYVFSDVAACIEEMRIFRISSELSECVNFFNTLSDWERVDRCRLYFRAHVVS